MKRKRVGNFDRVSFVWSICVLLISVFSGFAVYRLISVWPKESFEQKIIGSVMRQGEWFAQNQRDDGSFVYERYAATGQIKDADNIVRQAGALYGLAQLYRHTKDTDIERILDRGFLYFETLSATKSAGVRAVTQEGGYTPSNATALVVLGLSEYLDADESKRTIPNLEYLVNLSNYLVATQTETGSYVNDYGPPVTESDYNNGETMYALIKSYGMTQKESYRESVKRFADYAVSRYGKAPFNAQFFSWGMAGFAHLYATDPDETYWRFLSLYGEKYYQARGKRYEELIGDDSALDIAPGTSVFLEGVNHIAWIAREKDVRMYRIYRRHIEQLLSYLLRYEIGSPYGRFTASNESVRGAVCADSACETTRIDFLQHNMSAILLYLRFLI